MSKPSRKSEGGGERVTVTSRAQHIPPPLGIAPSDTRFHTQKSKTPTNKHRQAPTSTDKHRTNTTQSAATAIHTPILTPASIHTQPRYSDLARYITIVRGNAGLCSQLRLVASDGAQGAGGRVGSAGRGGVVPASGAHTRRGAQHCPTVKATTHAHGPS